MEFLLQMQTAPRGRGSRSFWKHAHKTRLSDQTSGPSQSGQNKAGTFSGYSAPCYTPEARFALEPAGMDSQS